MSLFHSLKNFISGPDRAAQAIPSISIGKRDVSSEDVPPNGKTENFDCNEAIQINRARMEHLDSLDLPIENKKVLDVGCGVGHLSQFFVRKGCKVVGLDARQENIHSLRERYPALESHVFNIEKDSLSAFGQFEIVFAYGLLYHLENPFAAIRSMASVCNEFLLLETHICDHLLPIVKMEDEPLGYNQAVQGVGCRPSPSYVVMALNRAGFPFVYSPKVPPEHPDFRFNWENNLESQRDGQLLRCIFIASRKALNNPKLSDLLEN